MGNILFGDMSPLSDIGCVCRYIYHMSVVQNVYFVLSFVVQSPSRV